MPALVQVSTIDTAEKLRSRIEVFFKNKQYAEISQSIGMHSILIDAEHTMRDQTVFYRYVLDLLKMRIGGEKGKGYGAWYKSFPKLLDDLVSSRQIVTDQAAVEVIASHRDAFGVFLSLDAFFFWALDDRKLTLGQIIQYIEKTVGMRAA